MFSTTKKNLRRSLFLVSGALAVTTLMALTACSGSGEDTADGNNALSGSADGGGDASSSSSIVSSDKTFKIAEVVFVSDVQFDDSEDGGAAVESDDVDIGDGGVDFGDGGSDSPLPVATGKPRGRILISNTPGICNRLDEALNMVDKEKTVSLWVDSASFSVGKRTFSGQSETAQGTSFIDETKQCSNGDTASPGIPRGKGSVTITTGGSTPAGSLDVTYGSIHLTGKFKAVSCGSTKHTDGIMNCPASAFDGDGGTTDDFGSSDDGGTFGTDGGY